MLKLSLEFVTALTIRGDYRKYENVDGHSVSFKKKKSFFLFLKSCRNGVIDFSAKVTIYTSARI